IAHWFLMPIGRATNKTLTQKAQTKPTKSTDYFCAPCGFRLCLLWLFPALLQELGDEAGPTRLMARADAGAIVAVEVFVEGNQVAPVGIGLKFLGRAKHRPSLIVVLQKNARQSL